MHNDTLAPDQRPPALSSTLHAFQRSNRTAQLAQAGFGAGVAHTALAPRAGAFNLSAATAMTKWKDR